MVLPRRMPSSSEQQKVAAQRLEWDVSRSLWASYQLPTASLFAKCFEADWKRSQVAHLVTDSGDLRHLKETLKEYYAEIKVLYSSLCTVERETLLQHPDEREKELVVGVGLNEYTVMLIQHNLLDDVFSLEE